jgi:hypothetical protein
MQPKNSEIGLSGLPTSYSTSLKSKLDGFGKSPTSALRRISRHCDVLSVRLIPRNLRALNLELFTLPSKSDFLRHR